MAEQQGEGITWHQGNNGVQLFADLPGRVDPGVATDAPVVSLSSVSDTPNRLTRRLRSSATAYTWQTPG
jgi:hypothetical protein